MPTRENIRLIARTPSFVVPFIIERCMRLNILSSKPYLSVILGVFAYMGHYQKMEESRKTKSLKISVKFFNLAATFIPNIHEGTNIQNMRSLTRRIIGQLIILCLLLRLKCQCSHKQTFYH